MQWLEADPIPEECKTCREGDCYNCDTAGKRWVLSEEDQLRLKRMGLVRAIQRLQRQVEQIDKELESMQVFSQGDGNGRKSVL